ncbi:hypothetical protein NEIRO03_2029 [Nematocida sp. AWRm78]|nr:hypothetical protein NEIRO02_2005 [Nematocida sp. AWRm79]KAI5185441.1 hypothetical protein NEIRO03_2029 [Nematocida sp. AWRm78]
MHPNSTKSAYAQIIFGEKTSFIRFNRNISITSLIKLSLLGLVCSIENKYKKVSEEEINLEEYSEFLFYIEDQGGRKIFLGREREEDFKELLKFFNYRLTIHIYIVGNK